MKKKKKVKDLTETKMDESGDVNPGNTEMLTYLTTRIESVLAELKSKAEAMIESMRIDDEIQDKLLDKEFEETLGFVRFFYSIIFLKDHPLRPFIAEHLKNGTCIERNEGIKLFKKYSA